MLYAKKLGASLKRAAALALLPLVLVGGAIAGPAGPAAAKPASADGGIGVMGCQSSYFWYYTSGYRNGIRCSGVYPVNQFIYGFDAGGWSGIVTYNGRSTWYFCDWEHGGLEAYVNHIHLYSTRAPWC